MVSLLNPRGVVVPTDDNTVKRQLRNLDQPANYFGEGPAERRERLAKILTNLSPEERAKFESSSEQPRAILDKNDDEAFYYEGTEALKIARYRIADHSIRQCNYRLDMARIKQLEPASTRLIPQQDLITKVRHLDNPETYDGEDSSTNELKTLTSCSFNPDATLLCTSSRSGRCKIWSLPYWETYKSWKGHTASANFITFSPHSGSSLSPSAANLASCSMDGSISLWNLAQEEIHDEPVCTLAEAPQPWRVMRVRYHPTGSYLASCCSDKSWRLWDLESQKEILHQEGHTNAVIDLAFHPDGSLSASAGLDCYGRVWDLRTGRSIQMLEGHSKGLSSIDFSPDGYHLATGSLDNSVKIWNLRQRKLEYTIPAHLNAVTTVMFEKENGFYLVTASFDRTVKFWSGQTWAPIKSLDAYDEKVANIDVSTSSNMLISCYAKFLKLWTSTISDGGDEPKSLNGDHMSPTN